MDVIYLKKVLIRTVSAVLAVIIAGYLLYHFVSDFGKDANTITAEVYNQREVLTLNAYIFRDETLLKSENSGDVDLLCSDGEKVKRGTPIANVYVGDESSSLRENLIGIDKKIALYQNSNIEINLATLDAASIDAQIRQLYYVICSRIESGDIEYALQKQDELLQLLNKRQIIIHAVENYDDMIALYEDKRAKLTEGFGETSESVSAPSSGYYYTGIDGYENIFSVSNIDEMNLESFRKIISSSPDTSLSESPNMIGKLVTNYRWYIACEVDSESTHKFVLNKNYDVIYPYNEDSVISMKLYRIITDMDSDKSVLIFSTGIMPDNFEYFRMQEVNIVVNDYIGYKLPVDAVRVVDGKLGVYILNGITVKFKKINTLIEESGYIIAEKNNPLNEDYAERLSEYDKIIIEGKGLYDGKIIN